jgi:TatD DNase family protein
LFVDSHCHLDFPELKSELPAVLDAMAAAEVTHALCISVTLEDWPGVHALALEHGNLYATAGVHPDYPDTREPSVDTLLALSREPKVVAIGETGLDYYRSTGDLEWCAPDSAPMFARLEGAQAAGHSLSFSAGDTLRIMREEGAGEVGGVMHCFTETWDVAKAAIEQGFHFIF